MLSDIPGDKAGQGSGATNTIRQLGASLGIALVGAVLFSTFQTAATPLVKNSTAFDDFGKRVTASETLSPASKMIGKGMASYGDQAKDGIIAGLQANEGFDPNKSDPLQTALDSVPSIAKTGLRAQGIDLDNPATIQQIKIELDPDVKILQADIQNALATGFSEAARTSTLLAAIFVLLGALSSLMLPNTRSHLREDSAVVAH